MHEESNNHLLLQIISFCKLGLKKSLHQGFEIKRGRADLHALIFLQENNYKKLCAFFLKSNPAILAKKLKKTRSSVCV